MDLWRVFPRDIRRLLLLEYCQPKDSLELLKTCKSFCNSISNSEKENLQAKAILGPNPRSSELYCMQGLIHTRFYQINNNSDRYYCRGCLAQDAACPYKHKVGDQQCRLKGPAAMILAHIIKEKKSFDSAGGCSHFIAVKSGEWLLKHYDVCKNCTVFCFCMDCSNAMIYNSKKLCQDCKKITCICE